MAPSDQTAPSTDGMDRKVLDLFAGLGGWSQAFAGRPGWEVTTVDFSEVFERKLWLDPWGEATLDVETHIQQDIVADIRELTWEDIGLDYDVVLAGPPCPGFSLMNVGDNWENGEPVTESARESVELLFKTFALVAAISPDYYAIENPVGMARDYLQVFADRVDLITQCQYGKRWQKRTYIAHNIPSFEPKRCSRGDDCHEQARRSDDAGTQAQNVAPADRAAIPKDLSRAVRDAIEAQYSGRVEPRPTETTEQVGFGEIVAVTDGGTTRSSSADTNRSGGGR